MPEKIDFASNLRENHSSFLDDKQVINKSNFYSRFRNQFILKFLFSIPFLFLLLTGCESSVVNPDEPGPEVRINYHIDYASHVNLVITNSYDTVVRILVDEVQTAGHYFALLETTGLPEGVYFYTLTAIGVNNKSYFESSKHLVLIK